MKSYLPCPRCQEHKMVSLLKFNYAYVNNIKHVEASCSKCNFITFAELPEEEPNE